MKSNGCALCHPFPPQAVRQRANLFSIFLAIPTGCLRAQASKQVQVDEDAESDGESDDAGDGIGQEGGATAQIHSGSGAAAEGQKVRAHYCS